MISDVANKIRSLQEEIETVLKKIKCLDSVFEEEKTMRKVGQDMRAPDIRPLI